jgi:acetyl-CoA carboxylase biotin carboxyl carrier protein
MPMQLTNRDVKKILEIIDAAPRVGEIEFVHNGLHFRCSRDPASTPQQTASSAYPPAAVQTSELDIKKNERQRDSPGSVIHAPLAGTFHRSPPSGQGLPIEAGARVQSGQTIAAIKTANRLTAIQTPAEGIVKHIFPSEGDFVEFDQPLFVIIRVT